MYEKLSFFAYHDNKNILRTNRKRHYILQTEKPQCFKHVHVGLYVNVMVNYFGLNQMLPHYNPDGLLYIQLI